MYPNASNYSPRVGKVSQSLGLCGANDAQELIHFLLRLFGPFGDPSYMLCLLINRKGASGGVGARDELGF